MNPTPNPTAHFHLPGLFEFYEFYQAFLPLFYAHRDWFFNWCDIGSIYGAPADCIWGGGRIENDDCNPKAALALMAEYNISARLTFSNSLLRESHLSDKKCNRLCSLLAQAGDGKNGVIVASDLLLQHLQREYPGLYFISSTTKVLTDFSQLLGELNREEFCYVVPDFRLNHRFTDLKALTQAQKDKVEFLCNECCRFGCQSRRRCYESVSRKALGEDDGFRCAAPGSEQGYRFSRAMKNPGFISLKDIQNSYLTLGFSNFKLEGRGLGSALLLEFILYYMTKPEYHLLLREELYLDNSLDLF